MDKKIFEEAIEKLKEILDVPEFKGNIYLVGGCVRDIVLEDTPKDIDLCIDLDNGSEIVVNHLKSNYPCCSGFVVYPRFNTSKFSLLLDSGNSVDIECVIPRKETYNSGPRKPDTVTKTSIYQDCMRRDFCCNALYMELWSSKILDPTHRGVSDCQSKMISTPDLAEKSYKDDPLRMLRAVRFCCEKGFELSFTAALNLTDIVEYYSLSRERVRDEFTKIIMSNDPLLGINMLKYNNLLNNISEDLEKAWKWNQNSKYHSMTLSKHLLNTLDYVIKNNLNTSLELRLAALFHDISKYKSFQSNFDGTYSFRGHDIESAELTKNILTNLKYPSKIIDSVYYLIKNHMCIKNQSEKIKDGQYRYNGTNKTIRRLIRKLNRVDLFDDLMILIEADNMNHHPDYCLPGQVESFKLKVELLNSDSVNKTKFPINGRDIIDRFNIDIKKDFKSIGEIKEELENIFDEDNNYTKDQLFQLYDNRFDSIEFYMYTDTTSKKDFATLDSNCLTISAKLRPKLYKEYLKLKTIDNIINSIPKDIRSINMQVDPHTSKVSGIIIWTDSSENSI